MSTSVSPRVQLFGSVNCRGECGPSRRPACPPRNEQKPFPLPQPGGLGLQSARAFHVDFSSKSLATTLSCAIRGNGEMLNPTLKYQSACLHQPFRFMPLGDDDHRKLRNGAFDSRSGPPFSLDPASASTSGRCARILIPYLHQQVPACAINTGPRSRYERVCDR